MTGVLLNSLPGVRVAIDRGGTFCDVWAYLPKHYYQPPVDPELVGNADIIPEADGSAQVTFKLLSVDPANYDDAPSEGIRRLLQLIHGQPIPKGIQYDTTAIESVRMGTTVATNALLERKGSSYGLVMTEGFGDLVEIGDQTRPDLFDLSVARKHKIMHDRENVVEASERVTMEGFSLDPKAPSPQDLVERSKSDPDYAGQVVIGLSGEAVRVLKPLDQTKLAEDLQKVYDREHERQVAQVARRIGFTQISLSSDLSPSIKVLPRANSAVIDAYLSPVLRDYVQGFNSHFAGGKAGKRSEFMKSDGGLIASDRFTGLRAVLSGPAGGFVGCALTAYSKSRGRPVVGFDMGGTSTDVSRFSGSFDMTHESVVALHTIACPQLAIETVAAGGGSRLQYKNGMFLVGPESVGAHPGPACYRKGGSLAITDANLILGRLVPSQFPSIFGPNADEPLDVEASRSKFSALTDEINSSLAPGQKMTIEEVAAGFIRVANEGMSRPMRNVTEQKGHPMASHDLCCFGGAGGQHACAIARGLGVQTVVIPRFSSILSAYGIACSDLSAERGVAISAEVPAEGLSESEIYEELNRRIAALKVEVVTELVQQDIAKENIDFTVTVAMHHEGSDSELDVPFSIKMHQDFLDVHFRETSFHMHRAVRTANVRVRGVGRSYVGFRPNDFAVQLEAARKENKPVSVKPIQISSSFFEVNGKVEGLATPVYALGSVATGSVIDGPAIIVDSTQTIVVEPAARAVCLPEHVILEVDVEVVGKNADNDDLSVDPVMLAVFANRFMSIAEQMGHTLQRTSVSVSIKERLDFSCSIHGTDGALVANAPHIPVHLGSMQSAVMAQHRHWLGKLRPGDVLLTNHPKWGGTHLPDLTVVTPVFDPNDDTKVLFYVASRGHHQDIGGSGVTAMNAVSKELWEEGIAVKTFKLVSAGKFDEEGIVSMLEDVGKRPGCSASRRIDHNITDLQAKVSANVLGTKLVMALFKEFGEKTVLFYMRQIQQVAQNTTKRFLRETYDRFGGKPLQAEDYIDNGTKIKLEVRINREDGTAVFDWTGTGHQVHANSNIPSSLTYAAIIYGLRCMISADIPMPLNQGVLDPVTNITPPGSIVNPDEFLAISGSTLTTQRLYDIVLTAFKAAACSQGCSSAVGFADGGKDHRTGEVTPGFAYGESCGGGYGAGPSWHGVSATHVHGTNTRMTDIEIVERRIPVILRHVKIRRVTGGRGQYNGGDGMSKLFEARSPCSFSIVSQRRVFAPKGENGGGNGAIGANTWNRRMADGSLSSVNVGSNGMGRLQKGDQFQVDTPGGGGWGSAQ
nr:uncharacterized protein CI109_006441 [Kwoniella shandongensis]KAA5525271.1 hypothetical protein CI109_006441 [Kwoniella shandongensis]